MPRTSDKKTYAVQVLGGRDGAERSSIVYSGWSEQFALHDVNTAQTTAQLSDGTVLILMRENGIIVKRLNVCRGMVLGASPAETVPVQPTLKRFERC